MKKNERLRTGTKGGDRMEPTFRTAVPLTLEQRRRMREGKSIYQRDKVVEKYDVKKGKWV